LEKKVGNSFSSLETLRFLFRNGQTGRGYLTKISFHWINVLPQPRKTFEKIPELANNIAENGLLSSPIVAEFDEEGAAQYLEVINEIWKTDFTVKDLKRFSSKYYILIAGERRLRSLRFLWERGCDFCREEYGQEESGICFKRHFQDEKIGASLWRDISPFRALFFQFSENIYDPPLPAEEAEAYQRLFKLVRQIDEKFSIAKFARCIGKNPQTISNALAFCQLPEVIQEYGKRPIKKGGIPYGIILQLTRLQKRGVSEENLIWWMTRALVGNYKIKRFKQLVDPYLREMDSGQTSLFGIMSEEQKKQAKRAFIKKTVAKNTIQEIWAYISYFRTVLNLFETGKIGLEDSPFSINSPKKVYKELIQLMDDQLFGHMEGVIAKNSTKKLQEILKEAKQLQLQLELKNVKNLKQKG